MDKTSVLNRRDPLDGLHSIATFSKFDMTSAYWQIQVVKNIHIEQCLCSSWTLGTKCYLPWHKNVPSEL